MDFKPGSKLDKELRNRVENSAITPNIEISEVCFVDSFILFKQMEPKKKILVQ